MERVMVFGTVIWMTLAGLGNELTPNRKGIILTIPNPFHATDRDFVGTLK